MTAPTATGGISEDDDVPIEDMRVKRRHNDSSGVSRKKLKSPSDDDWGSGQFKPFVDGAKHRRPRANDKFKPSVVERRDPVVAPILRALSDCLVSAACVPEEVSGETVQKWAVDRFSEFLGSVRTPLVKEERGGRNSDWALRLAQIENHAASPLSPILVENLNKLNWRAVSREEAFNELQDALRDRLAGCIGILLRLVKDGNDEKTLVSFLGWLQKLCNEWKDNKSEGTLFLAKMNEDQVETVRRLIKEANEVLDSEYPEILDLLNVIDSLHMRRIPRRPAGANASAASAIAANKGLSATKQQMSSPNPIAAASRPSPASGTTARLAPTTSPRTSSGLPNNRSGSQGGMVSAIGVNYVPTPPNALGQQSRPSPEVLQRGTVNPLPRAALRSPNVGPVLTPNGVVPNGLPLRPLPTRSAAQGSSRTVPQVHHHPGTSLPELAIPPPVPRDQLEAPSASVGRPPQSAPPLMHIRSQTPESVMPRQGDFRARYVAGSRPLANCTASSGRPRLHNKHRVSWAQASTRGFLSEASDVHQIDPREKVAHLFSDNCDVLDFEKLSPGAREEVEAACQRGYVHSTMAIHAAVKTFIDSLLARHTGAPWQPPEYISVAYPMPKPHGQIEQSRLRQQQSSAEHQPHAGHAGQQAHPGQQMFVGQPLHGGQLHPATYNRGQHRQ